MPTTTLTPETFTTTDLRTLDIDSVEQAIDFVQRSELDKLGELLFAVITLGRELANKLDVAEVRAINADRHKSEFEEMREKYYAAILKADHLQKAVAHIAASLS